MIFAFSHEQAAAAEKTHQAYATDLGQHGCGAVTTEIREAPPFFYAEDYHQQYLAKNPNGYCGMGGTGVRCPA